MMPREYDQYLCDQDRYMGPGEDDFIIWNEVNAIWDAEEIEYE